jgi:hypothetical protein
MDSMDQGFPQLSDVLKDMIKTGEAVGPLEMPDGRTSATLTAATSAPGQSNKKEELWPFQVPKGYIRYSGDFRKDRHSGDVAHCDFSNGNPNDGTVHAYVKASQTNGYAHVSASNVYAIKPEAISKLYKEIKG